MDGANAKEEVVDEQEAKKRDAVDSMTAKIDATRLASERAAMMEPKGRLFHVCNLTQPLHLVLHAAAGNRPTKMPDRRVRLETVNGCISC